MSRDTQAMQDDDTANPGMLWVLDGEALWNAQGRRGRQILRRLPRRRARQHEGRRCALSGLRRRRSAARSISSSASTCAAPSISRRRRFAYESHELLALTAFVAQQSRGVPIAPATDPQTRAVHRQGPRAVQAAPGPAQSVLRAIATTTTGASSSPASAIPQGIRPAIRSTGWNGKRSARCSGACATA